MFSLFSTPGWFNGIDLVFDSITLLIAISIAAYSWKIYKLSDDNKFAYFSFSFSLISLALFFKLITYGILYYHPVRETAFQVLKPLTQGKVSYMDLFYRVGFFMQMASMLGGWLLIFLISQKSRSRLRRYHEVSQIGLFAYLILLLSFVSNFRYEVFYLTSLVLLSLIVLNYYKNYLNNNKNKNTLLVMKAFMLIFLSQLLFLFMSFWNGLYFVGETLLLAGFLLILYVYRRIINL